MCMQNGNRLEPAEFSISLSSGTSFYTLHCSIAMFAANALCEGRGERTCDVQDFYYFYYTKSDCTGVCTLQQVTLHKMWWTFFSA